MNARLGRHALHRRSRLVPVASLALAVVGYVHLDLYLHGYRAIPVIGRLFVANVVASGVVATLLLFVQGRLVRLAGLSVAAATVVAFALSRLPNGLFGFQERGLEPSPQAAISLGASLVAAILLVLSLVSGRRALVAVVAAGALTAGACAPVSSAAGASKDLGQIQHIVVVDLENWSFDSLYGHFPGADGIAGADDPTQVDVAGVPYAHLPQPLDSNNEAKPTPGAPPPVNPPDPRFPADLPNAPFDLTRYAPPTEAVGDLTGRFYQEQAQIDGGRMDRFVANGGAGGLPMGSYDASALPLGRLAKRFTLADQFFHAAFGGSLLNHFWLVSAATPRWADAPASMRAVLGPEGTLQKDGAVTPEGFLVNTAYPAKGPHPVSLPAATELVPPLHDATIGDRLSAKGVSWAWYAGGWSDALAGHPAPLFQFNHQPFSYFANYAAGTRGQKAHLKDERDLVRAIARNALPAVSFYKPIGTETEHPGYANVIDGERHVAGIVDAIMASSSWKSTAIVVTYDENGGFWDHVPPPFRDSWGPGTRVPTMVISPFAKRHFVDHTTYDTTSILSLIEHRFRLAPLGSRDASAPDMQNAFRFQR